MKPIEIYQLTLQHSFNTELWKDKIEEDVIGVILRQGFTPPLCFGFFYNFKTNSYRPMRIDMDVDALLNPVDKLFHLNLLRDIETIVPETLIAIRMVSEGMAEMMESRDKVSFLMITFETYNTGYKRIYTLRKTSFVEPDGTTSLKVSKIEYDEDISLRTDIPLLEDLAHILRPNYSNTSSFKYN